ncbi:MAG TPA: glycosyltransferase [Burkholderiaceae bacterium]|nr:glycosyltransferase [Burkholderiaceae bacterium]
MSDTRSATFSISVEWENARFAELQRTRLMLRALRKQIVALPAPPALPVVNFLYDRHSIDAALVQRVLAEEFTYGALPATTQIIPTDGLRYYEQKNLGAASASGDIKIFLDCDVVPEPGWLAAMLESFDNPDVGAVAGETYIEQTGFYSKAFSLFWFFPLRDCSEALEPAPRFHANNVAFRSEVFAKHPFPTMDAYRAQCVMLGRTLHANHIGLYVQKRARVSHPCPLGVRYYMARALHNGRDWILISGLDGQRDSRTLKLIYWTLRSNLKRTFGRIRQHRQAVGLGPLGNLAARGLATSYFLLQAIGSAVSVYRRDAIPRHFPI